MAEVIRRPTQIEMDRLREAYGDNIVFAMVKSVTDYLNQGVGNIEIDFTEYEFRKWKSLTRRLLHNVSALKVYYELDRIVYEVANDQWSDFEIPRYEKSIVEFKINPKAKKISEKISILDVAKKYGLKVKANKCPCPFHADKAPSLVFYPKTNSFYCFGCNTGGDVISFIQNMMEVKNGK